MAKPKSPSAKADNPDRAALVRVGERVRARLSGDPGVQRVAADRAELFLVPDFLTRRECERFIAMVDAVAKPSAIYHSGADADARTSYSGDVDPADPFVKAITRRIDDLLGLDASWGETVQGQRYLPGQQFKQHCDWFPRNSQYWDYETGLGGQRSWTAMIYLNEVEEGGTTDFPSLGFSSAPRTGSLLAWNNATPDGAPNVMTVHAGMPVVRGVKYVITKWYRTRAWGLP